MADSNDSDEPIDPRRRRFMKIAVYTPPTIIGIIQLNNAACQATSCGPNQCNPNTACGPNSCQPIINPCNPQNCNPSTCNPQS